MRTALLEFNTDDKFAQHYHKSIATVQDRFNLTHQSALGAIILGAVASGALGEQKAIEAQEKLDWTIELDNRRPNEGYVYFVKADGRNIFKIGVTKSSPYKRMAGLQSGCPYKVGLYGYLYYLNRLKWEKRFHKELDRYRLNGEWFEVDEAIVDGIISRQMQRARQNPESSDTPVETFWSKERRPT